MQKEIRLRGALRLAGAFTACAIGSGFATGQEIMQFFTGQGVMSLAGTVVTTVIFAWCGSCFMKHGFRRKLDTPENVLTYYFGGKAGRISAVFFQIFLYAVYIIMISGGGAAMSEHFGLPPMAGRILIAVLTLATVISGLRKAADILGSAGSIIIAASLYVGIAGFCKDPHGLASAGALIPRLDMTVTPGGWLWSSILYPCFNAVAVIFLSCCLGSSAESEKEASLGGALGGILFGLAILAMDLGITVNIETVFDKAVPTLALAEMISPVLADLFSIVIFCGIYTTAVPMLWGVVRHFAEDRTKKSVFIALGLTAAGLILSMTDFKKLVNTVYPFSGYAGIVLMLVVAYREMQDRQGKKKRASEQP